MITADVVVVGAGPAGSIAAKNCAQHGMRTVLLEKKALPRRKVCCGLLVSNLARALIAKELGVIPERALTDPAYIYGYQWHTSGSGDERQEMPGIINTWRKELDYWMNQKARVAGAEIWEKSIATSIIQGDNNITLKVARFDEEHEIRARFVIGADGANSIIRKCLFPELKAKFIGIYTECHPGMLNIDRQYFHIFGSARTVPSSDWFDIIHKEDCFLINVNGAIRSPKEAMTLAKKTLAEKWGFNIKNKPLWTDGTVVPVLRDFLYSGQFLPAKGNVLLVGDAAGISTPSDRGEGEGINIALKTGALASAAIIKAADTSVEAEDLYLNGIGQVLSVCKALADNIIHYTVNWKQREELLNELL